MPASLKLIATLVGLALAPSLVAEEKIYDLTIGETPIGTLSVDHEINGNQYDFHAQYHPTGLIGALSDWGLDMQVSGLGTKYQRYFPNQSRTQIRARNIYINRETSHSGAKIRLSATPYVETQVDPKIVGDSVDWVTALAYVMRDQSATRICSISVPIYEGDFLMRVILRPPEKLDPSRVRCRGAWRLVAGFGPTRFDDGEEFYFSALYRRVDSTEYTLDRAIIDTPLGSLTLVDQASAEGDGLEFESPDPVDPDDDIVIDEPV